LEAIALKMSLEDTFESLTRSDVGLSVEVNPSSEKAKPLHPLIILHEMGEVGSFGRRPSGRSTSLLANMTVWSKRSAESKSYHLSSKMSAINKFWKYAFDEGMPKGYKWKSPDAYLKGMDRYNKNLKKWEKKKGAKEVDRPKPPKFTPASWGTATKNKAYKKALIKWYGDKKKYFEWLRHKKGKKPESPKPPKPSMGIEQNVYPFADVFKSKMMDYVYKDLFIAWPDYKKWKPEGKYYQRYLTVTDRPSPKKYVSGQLEKDWNSNTNLIVATGHGGWFKRLVRDRRVDQLMYSQHRDQVEHADKLSDYGEVWKRTMSSGGAQLDYTEFVLLRWRVLKHTHMHTDPELVIDKVIRPGQTWYNMKRLMGVMGVQDPAAHDADFGDNFGSDYYEDGYDYDFGFDDGGDYDDEEFYDDQDYDFGYYDDGENGYDDGEYGYDDDEQYAYDQYEDEQYDYDEDYDYDQSDDDAYSLYEQAAVNLKRAKEEFRIAQQLRKWKGVKGRRDYN